MMIRLFLVLLVGMGVCAQAKDKDKGTFLKFSEYPAAKNSWGYRTYIVRFNEPPFGRVAPDAEEVYRLFFVPSAAPAFMATIIKHKDHIVLETKISGGLGGYDIAGEGVFSRRRFSSQEWNRFSNQLRQMEFFSTPSETEERLYLGGYVCVLEGRKNGVYHYVSRGIPGAYPEDEKFDQLCSWLYFSRVKTTGIVETVFGGVGTTDGRGLVLRRK